MQDILVHDAAGEREMAPKCVSLPRDARDLVGLLMSTFVPRAGKWLRKKPRFFRFFLKMSYA